MVFILLIFFIVTSNFSKDAAINISKPAAQSAQPVKSTDIVFTITPNGSIYSENRLVDIYAVRSIIKKKIASSSAAANSSILIFADKDSKTEILISLMDQCKLAGAENIHIAAGKLEK